ncbi:hypothetical protein H4582DRAFT_2068978 [Lactarius indigo]|nr:hypothetical protein H4582DRAFT_2068978 [Lactarius indigo]
MDPSTEDEGLRSDEAGGQGGSASDDEDDADPCYTGRDRLHPRPSFNISIALFNTGDPHSSVCAPHTAREVLPTVNPEDNHTPLSVPFEPPVSPFTSTVASTPWSSWRRLSAATTTGGKKRFPGSWNQQKSEAFKFGADNDSGIAGTVIARDPRCIGPSAWRNIVSFGQVFRTCIIWHSLNLVWEELLLYMRKYEQVIPRATMLDVVFARLETPKCQAQARVQRLDVTRLAVCAIQGWARVDRIVVSNFVTAIQAQCKRYTSVLFKVSAGELQDRHARKLLKSLSAERGIKYGSPESTHDFQRLSGLTNSTADCRLAAFETISEATRLWVEGCEFAIARSLGDVYKGQLERYAGDALAIFSLASQDAPGSSSG